MNSMFGRDAERAASVPAIVAAAVVATVCPMNSRLVILSRMVSF
jgi:hypothetical protein